MVYNKAVCSESIMHIIYIKFIKKNKYKKEREQQIYRRNIMKKIICSAICCAAAGVMLAGCTIPGISDGGSDNSMTDSYSYSPTEEQDDTVQYSWIMEPNIIADNIIVFDGSQVDSSNEDNNAYANYAVICSNGKYGLMDYKGNTVIEPEYEDYYTCWCGEIVLFNTIDAKNNEYKYCTIDSTKQISDTPMIHEDKSPRYYWDAEAKKTYVKRENEDYATEYTGKKTVVVCEAEISDQGAGYFSVKTDEEPVYGLVKKNKVLIEPEYVDFYAPAYKGAGATCIAFKNSEGLWGYVNSDGKTIIDFKCDGDMSTYNGSLIDSEEKSHPFLFNGDYVPVSVGASYGYYDKDGNVVVRPGEFEQARPVHNGRAWVRKDGLWGIIKLGEIVEDEPTKYEDPTSKTSTTSKKSSTSTSTSTSTTTSTTSITSTTSGTLSDTGTTAADTGYTTIDTEPEDTTTQYVPPVTDPVTNPPEPEPTQQPAE